MQANLITNKSNIKYLSNFSGSSGFMLLTKKKKYLFTDFRYIERAKTSVKKDIEIIDTLRMWRNQEDLKNNWGKILKKHKINQINIEESSLTIKHFKKFKEITKKAIPKNKIKYSDISGEIETMREVKTKEEIKLITKSQRINEKVFLDILILIKNSLKNQKKISEIEIAWEIKRLGHKYGAEDISFEPIVCFGKHSSIPHHLPSKSTLKKGQMILIDMGMKYKGYCSDMTRTLFTAPATKEQKEVYNTVLQAQLNGLKNIKAGITGKKADELSRKIIEKAGYGKYYGHAGGHGVGLDIHEAPSIYEKYQKPLKENSIITIEPGIYLEGKFGVRIEDMAIVSKKGTKNITKIPKSQELLLDMI